MAMPTYVGLMGSASALQVSGTRNWPGGHQADDVAILFVIGSNVGAVVPTTGWTEFSWSGVGVIKTTLGTAALDDEVRVFWKRATSGAEAAASLPDNGGAGADWYKALGVVVRGLPNTGEPVNAHTVVLENTSTTTVAFPTITTTQNDCFIVYLLTNSVDTAVTQFSGALVNTDLANIVQVNNANSSTGDGGGQLLIYGERATAGAIGAGTGFVLLGASPQNKIVIALGTPPPSTVDYSTVVAAGSFSLTGQNILSTYTPAPAFPVAATPVILRRRRRR